MRCDDVRLARLCRRGDGRQHILRQGRQDPPRPTADVFLNGITRQTVIELARKRGFEVSERIIEESELAGFEQCFLTGTAAEVTRSPR